MKRLIEDELGDSDEFVNFSDQSRFVLTGNVAVVSLRPGERLSVWGQFHASCVAGNVHVTGWRLTEEPQIVRAPLCHAAASFCCPVSAKQREEIGGVVKLERAVGLFSVDESLFIDSDRWVVVANGDTDAVQVFPRSWQQTLDEVEHGRTLICGNRGVGKSTLVRYAVNRKLSAGRKVILVDTDPGQTELGPPGTICVAEISSPMLCPGFCGKSQLRLQAVTTLAVAGTSPDRDVDAFAAAVTRLSKFVPEDAVHVIVNSPGWISGLGLETLRNTYAVMKCRAALQLHDPQNALHPVLLTSDAVVYPLVARTFVPIPRGMPSSLMRDWRMCDYFEGTSVVRHPLSKACIAIHDGDDVPDHLVLPALLETVVALMIAPSFRGREGRFCPVLPDDGVLVGLAFVKGIVVDGLEGVLFELRSPVKSLEQVNVIARMHHETPSSLRSAKYSENPAANKMEHYAIAPMTGAKFILRSNKDF